ncbi:DUF2325 domain-containing protein [Paraburkholderia sp. Tr-20389]|nr:DUF2325 domain-containing protein [Paraburkholderia sp. Tr-20389]
MRLRAASMIKETALAWALEDMEAIKAAVPGLPTRLVLARQVQHLESRVQSLAREHNGVSAGRQEQVDAPARREPSVHRPQGRETIVLWIGADGTACEQRQRVDGKASTRIVPVGGVNPIVRDTDLAEADLVICQTGCLSHHAWWRVKDHCKRTGKQCVLVERPDALQRLFGFSSPEEIDPSSTT